MKQAMAANSTMGKIMRWPCLLGSLMICAGLILPAPDVSAATGTFALSEKKGKEIGAEMYAEILQNMPIYHDEELQKYVEKIGRELAKYSDRPDLEYTFTIIDSNEINAFATPGGYVYVNRGLLAYVTSEAQMAAVIAHEIGHIAARHASKQKTAGTTANAVTNILAALIAYQTGSGVVANEVANATSMAGTALVRGYGRDMELEADELGAVYLAKMGYDPQAVAEVIGVLKDHENFSRIKAKDSGKPYQGYHGLFATHPRNDQRLQNIIKNADSAVEGQVFNTDNSEFRSQMDMLKFSDESLTSAIVENRYYHRSLDFSVAFPTGWEIKKGSSGVQATGPADRSVIQMRVKSGIKDMTPRQYLEDKLGVGDLQDGEELKLGELVGYTGLQGEGKEQRIAVIFHRGRAFIFLARADNEALNRFYDTLFISSINSFRPLTEDDKIIALSRKIRYLQVNSDLTYEQLSKYSPLKEYPEEQLRLINGDYPNGEPEEGEWVKIVD
jgi:predicted Zn-dependent protease